MTTRGAGKTISAHEAAALVKSGDWLDYGAVTSQPDVFDKALAERVDELTDVNIRACLSLRPRAVIEADPNRQHFNFFNWHFSAYDRKKADLGLEHYMPCNLGEVHSYYARFIDPPDIMVIKTRPADANGHFNFGPANLWYRAIAERAKIVIVEITNSLPYCEGNGNGLHVSEIDYIIEGDSQPCPELPNAAPSDVDRAVGQLIANEIDNEACLQIGIGAMPNAVCSLLLESGVRDLGVHTEMLTDGIIDLYRAGVVTNAKKNFNQGKVVTSFGLGSASLYETIDRNTDFSFQEIELTNLPHLVMKNDRLTAINNTTQMDLQGQAASESDGFRHITGTGGQLQFVRAAYASKGGKSFICMSSIYERHGERKSRVVLNLTPGNITTVPRTDMMYVVTEYGIVNLKGRSVPERVRLMISIAHPDFRDDLARDARAANLLPRQVL